MNLIVLLVGILLMAVSICSFLDLWASKDIKTKEDWKMVAVMLGPMLIIGLILIILFSMKGN